MTITNIRAFTNASSVDLYLLNLENPEDTGGSATTIAAHGGVYTHDMWIPWCNVKDWAERDLFPQHHIAIWDQPDTSKVPIFCIWQEYSLTSNRVCHSTNGQWTQPGNPVTGDSGVGGDRSLVISQAPQGFYLLTILTYSVSSSSSSSPVPFDMIPDGAPNSYGADISDGELSPIDFRINGVQNVTQGTGSDPSTLTMILSHRNFSRPTVIPPNSTSHAFDGQPLTGHWQAILTPPDITPTRTRASLIFYVI